jgi:hypothetical protein
VPSPGLRLQPETCQAPKKFCELSLWDVMTGNPKTVPEAIAVYLSARSEVKNICLYGQAYNS